ncbi:MAG TPA: hypothetical protein VHW01_00825 [Polyangiaceae bacterium]|nr:hypothetical protein [Polyangiaceae bacterium]
MRAAVVCVTSLGLAGALASCSKPDSRALVADQSVGVIGLALELSPGVQVNSVSYTITGPNGYFSTGTVDVSQSAQFSALIGGIPAGSGYLISLNAKSADGQTSCSGQASFTVVAGQTNAVPIELQCQGPDRFGDVTVNSTFSLCPLIDSFSITPLSIVVGGSISLTVSGHDPDPGPEPLSYAWTASTGTFSAPTSTVTSYKCTSVGTQTINIAVSDGNTGVSGCPATLSEPVSCVACGADNTACSDGNACTLNDACHANACVGSPAPARTACSQGPAKLCDGAGSCVECVSGGDCPGSDTACSSRTCSAGKCGVSFAPAGTLIAAQTAGDCHVNQCDGAGNIASVVDDSDVPVDGRACTADTCSAGVPSNPPLAAEVRCETSRVCDGAGSCVDCVVAADCQGSDSTCSSRTCSNNQCGVKLASEGTTCADSGGQICNGAGSCVPVSFRIVRVGTGTTTLTNTAAPVFVEQRGSDGTLVASPIALPTAATGSNQPFSLTGLAVTEGDVTRSADGRYLALTGYAAAPGFANLGTSLASDVKRIVARLDAAGVVDTSTIVGGAFNAGSPRSATSSDGSAFWVSGMGAAASGTPPSGIWYVPMGSSSGTQLLSTGVRWLRVFGNQLYVSGNDSSLLAEILAVGSGLPQSGAQSASEFPGMPTGSGPSPWGFALLDRSAAVPGPDTLYVADDRTSGGGGIQKWTFDGTKWTLALTMNLNPATRFRGLGAVVTGTNVTLMATTVESNSSTKNRLVVFLDDGSPSPVGTVVSSTPSNELYRGVAPNPHP